MTNSARHSKNKWNVLTFEVFAIAALFALRIFRLDQTGLFDYDAVKNYLIVEALWQGDFTDLFHHASPSFFLLFAPIYGISKHFLILEYANAALGVGAVLLFARFFRKLWLLTNLQYLLLLMGIGSSTFLIVSSRYFSIENLTLLLFGWVITLYHQHLTSHRRKDWVAIWILMALSFSVNYKTLLLLPIFLVVESLQRNRKLRWKELMWIPAAFMGLGGLYSLLGKLLGIGFLNYAKNIYVVAFVRDTNPAIDKSKFDWELTYYFKYFYDFENILLPIGLGLLLVATWKKWPSIFSNIKTLKIHFTGNLLLVCFTLSLLAGMSIVEKAPRAILLTYPLIYAFGIYGLMKTIKINRYAFAGTMVLFIGMNTWNAQRFIYQYAKSSYNEMAEAIAGRGIEQVSLTVGLGMAPYLNAKGVRWKVLFSEQELQNSEQEGWLILDDYQQIAGLGDFKKWRDLQPIVSFKDPSLLSPYLYLEHCEYTDQGYDEAIANWKLALKDSVQLSLVSW